MEWDESEIIDNELAYRKDNWEEFSRYKGLKENPTEEQLRKDLYRDSDFLRWEWEDFISLLSETVQRKNPGGYWKAAVKNFGWRNLNGFKYCFADSGEKLIREILPECDCTFRIFNHGKGLAIQNFHHDSPTGNEWYYLVPIAQSTYENNHYIRG